MFWETSSNSSGIVSPPGHLYGIPLTTSGRMSYASGSVEFDDFDDVEQWVDPGLEDFPDVEADIPVDDVEPDIVVEASPQGGDGVVEQVTVRLAFKWGNLFWYVLAGLTVYVVLEMAKLIVK